MEGLARAGSCALRHPWQGLKIFESLPQIVVKQESEPNTGYILRRSLLISSHQEGGAGGDGAWGSGQEGGEERAEKGAL